MSIEKINRIIAASEEGTTVIGTYYNSKTRLDVKCVNGHIRSISPEKLIARGDSSHCKVCGTNTHGLRRSDESFKLALKAEGLEALTNYTNNHSKVSVRNIKCGHNYLINPNSFLTKGTGKICRVCFPVNMLSTEQVVNDLLTNNLELQGEYLGSNISMLVKNSGCGHVYYVDRGGNLDRGIGNICRVCSPANFKPISSIEEELKNLGLELMGEYLGTKRNIMVRNTKCKHEYEVLATNCFSKGQGALCKICYPNMSTGELEVLEYIRSIYKGWVISGDRKILEGKELDIVLPDLGIAIEYNGVYWHRESDIRDKHYHLDKLSRVTDFGYQLISISEDTWIHKKEIVKSRLLSMLKGSATVFARNTKIGRIDFPVDFLNSNHMQGAGAHSTDNYGLFLEDELVAVMTFSKPKFNPNYDYELVRYCSLTGVNIVGGASKLLKYFRIGRENKSIISYSDKEWSTGNLYKQLHFTLNHTSTPGYTWYKGLKSISRYKSQKHKLEGMFPEWYSKDLTEVQIMTLAGYYRVFDCGNDVWVLK